MTGEKNTDDPKTLEESDIYKPETCAVDHLKEGFEGQAVYAWRGPFKGKLGVVVRVSGRLASLSVESAMNHRSILDLPAKDLVA